MKKFILSIFIFSVYLSLNGCVNVTQKNKIESDGSGTVKLEYWAKMNNLKNKKELGGFNFDEPGVKEKYTSSNNEITSVKIEDKLEDSTKHVIVDIKFKDFNNLSSCSGFSKIKSEWKKGENGMEFKYILPKDTSAAKTMGASGYKLKYEFEFPGEVTATNGIKDGKSAKWEKTHVDLKSDIEMTATVKGGESGGKCGMFGFELPVVFILGLTAIKLGFNSKE